MFNIVLLVFITSLCLVSMATKSQRRSNFSKYINGSIDHRLQIGSSLAANTLIGSNITQVTVDTCRLSSIKCSYSLNNFTPTANAGPIIVGVAHSDYTDAEVEQWLETSGSWDRGNTSAREQRSRMVRQIGRFNIGPDGASTDAVVLNGGRPIKTKLNWLLTEGQTVKFWAFNSGSVAVATTNPNFEIQGDANLWVV